MDNRVHEPVGVRFYDGASQRNMVLVTKGYAAGWLCYRHPDGQWVLLREATEDDREMVTEIDQ